MYIFKRIKNLEIIMKFRVMVISVMDIGEG